MRDIFAPYETLYVDESKRYGKINLANNRAKMLEELPQGSSFDKLPYYCYAYDSIFSQAIHLNIPTYSAGEAVINGTKIDYGEWVKHYVSFFPNMMVQNCLGDTDRISNDNYNNNIGAFKPLDIDFKDVRLGMRYTVMDKETKQTFDVQSTYDLWFNYTYDNYVVTETQCNIMYYSAGGMYTYNSDGVSDISINFNVGDRWIFGNHPTEYGQHGLQLVPQWWIRLRDYGAEAYSPFHDADTGFVFQGLGVEEVRLSTEDEFFDLGTGCLLYRSNQWYDGVEYRPVLTVRQCLSEVAFLGLVVCDFEDPNNERHLMAGYINKDGLATGEILPYSIWKDSDSLNRLYNQMSDYTDDLDKDPKPRPVPPSSDEDDTENMPISGVYTAGGMVNYYAITDKSTLDDLSTCLSSWDYVETGKDVLRNLISLKVFPIERVKLCRGTLKQIVIAGVKAVKIDELMRETPIRANTVDSVYSSLNFGSIEIPAKFGDFRDFAPYTKLELYIPFCGWIELPSHCMGHSVKVELTYDIVTGTCKAFVLLDNNTIVSEICGVLSYDIPFTADAVGMKAAGVISGILGVAASAVGTLGSLGSGLNFASNAIGLGNSITQLVTANNANYTEVRGNTGDSNNFAGPKKCFLKISRPISNIPDNYARAVGWLYNKSATLESGMGFTTIDNPIIHGSMTQAEKSSIQSLLMNGVIL